MSIAIARPAGLKTKIVLCMGSSCFARGNGRNLEVVEAFLREHRLDAEVEIAGSLCEGKCGSGPVISVDGKTLPPSDAKTLKSLLAKELLKGK